MAFNVIQFLNKYNIEYVTSGPRTSRGNVNCRCPLCALEGHYLGISLHGRGWNCWRNMAHRGKSYVKLVQLLLKCDRTMAEEIVGVDAAAMPQDVSVSNYVREKFGMTLQRKAERLRLLPEFKPITSGGIRVRVYQQYLFGRGYRPTHLEWLYETYQVHYAHTGPFARRVIVPIYDESGRLVCWTGRSVRDKEKLRYRALSTRVDHDLPLAVVNPQDALLSLAYLHRCDNPRVLLVVEGPFDAMWLTLWGRTFGVYATCLFGLNMSTTQMGLLSELQDRFDESILLLDDDAELRAFRLASNPLSLTIKRLKGTKDPAALSPSEAQRLCVSCLS